MALRFRIPDARGKFIVDPDDVEAFDALLKSLDPGVLAWGYSFLDDALVVELSSDEDVGFWAELGVEEVE